MTKQKRGRNKKAVFFSLDALIALAIILLSITVIYPIIRYSEKESSVPEDIISSLSALKIEDMNSPNVNQWRIDGNITNLNKSVLEQIGEFYVNEDTKPMAIILAEEVLLTINTNENIGIWYDDDLLASKNKTSVEEAKNVNVERQIISGIKEGNETTGYSARAFLTNSVQTKYYYFGGYVGEGNITLNVEYNGSLEKIELEVAANKQFKICINNHDCIDSLAPVVSEFQPNNFPLSAHKGDFDPNVVNTFKLVAADGSNNLHVAGGYLKLTYSDGVQYEQPEKYYFPGIEGIINLYDGFYVPGQLNNLSVYLHFKSNYTALLTIGNKTIYQTTPSPDEKNLNFIPSGLDYNDLSKKTIPLRLRLANVSYTTTTPITADVFSVTDISGSMGNCALYNNCHYHCGGNRYCLIDDISYCTSPNKPCGGSCATPNSYVTPNTGNCNKTKLGLAKSADNDFIDIVLNNSGNRVGLVGYSTDASDSNYHILSNDSVSLKTEVNSWNAVGGTCICCGINRAVNGLAGSGSDKFKSIVIMSDGQPTYYCSDFDSYTEGGGNGMNTGYLEQQWAINASCHAWQNHGIKVYAIGFGSDVNETTMRAIATCGNGSYYYGDVNNIANIYQQVAQDIIEAAYYEQTVEFATGNISTVLYPDSYIQFNYTREKTPYGLVITEEENFTDTYSGSFNIPLNSSAIETRVISYSGPRWTKEVSINNTVVYNLSKYGNDYIPLGDPYAINIPNSAVGNSNIVRLTTGTSPTNTSAGSSFNKIIYTILKNIVSYSAISQYANGCNWTVQFEDNTNLTVEIPANATELCYYKSDDYDGPGSTDALQIAVYKLFKKLDLDNNGKLDVKFTEQNLQVSSANVTGIPFPWETEVQVRKWW